MPRKAAVIGMLTLALALGGTVAADATGSRPVGRASKGCVVPDVHKLTLARAKSRIVAAGCKVGRVSETVSAAIKKGHVVFQSPAAGRHIASTRHVSLTISLGSQGQSGPPSMPCVNCGTVG